ncbi:MAG: hypothetical protein A2W01_12250 [Candidatus Solincola sediminis]|uniref:UDP-N-acetylglucosamine--N-acetylmuramyl-(pentapeptide) pyrophosphoryl-undecaprenol N-acetylglucosamine transferase n=1 Tax=Candidatus Solincola sediminis TaxID=1797199 RepID=A0A1F2WS12_9ACTN|nr:MAG: hypothetical protein A2Y75_01325 [Candidatus Solincola sediminis]OFW60940.1 MAG: hypothetical protein A2W01_12250 [Candidatus Solincola sediminis]
MHPLLALAEELQSHENIQASLFLNRKALSKDLAFEGKVIPLDVAGLKRSADPSNFWTLLALPRAILTARRAMKTPRPGVVVGFGGYASMPGALAGLTLRIPLIIHEQNIIPGLANRLLAPFAARLAVSFEATLEKFPGWRKKAVLTGNPLYHYRRNDEAGEDAWEYFNLEKGRATVAILGGSQGAASINRAVLGALPLWGDRADLQIIHSVGRDKYQEFKVQATKVDIGGLIYRPLEFIERMDLVYGCADIAVSRAGASTISELAAAGCPAILVPYPFATAAHQEANAAVLERAGGARVISDADLDAQRLVHEIDDLLADRSGLMEMRESASRVGKADATERLAAMVMALEK